MTVESGADRIYQCDAAAGGTSVSQSPSTHFALTAGKTIPRGIADSCGKWWQSPLDAGGFRNGRPAIVGAS